MEHLAACELVFASFEHVSVCLTVESVNKFEYRILCRHNWSKQEYCIECFTEKMAPKTKRKTDVNINWNISAKFPVLFFVVAWGCCVRILWNEQNSLCTLTITGEYDGLWIKLQSHNDGVDDGLSMHLTCHSTEQTLEKCATMQTRCVHGEQRLRPDCQVAPAGRTPRTEYFIYLCKTEWATTMWCLAYILNIVRSGLVCINYKYYMRINCSCTLHFDFHITPSPCRTDNSVYCI